MKRPVFNLFILIGAVVILFAGLAMVLIIAPGVKIFDIQYIRSSESAYAKTYTASAESESGYKTIEINGLTTDINIKFVQAQNVYISYHQHFSGFTRTKIDSPELFAEEVSDTLKITVREYESFVYGSSDKGDGLYVEIPIYFAGKLVVTANYSNIYFSGLYGEVDTVSVTTKNKVVFGDKFKTNNLILDVKQKDIVLGSDAYINKSIEMKSSRASLTVYNEVGENLIYTSSYGHLNFLKVNGNATVNTRHGKILGIDDKLPYVLGDADMYSGGGITLANVYGNAKLSSNSGDIVFGNKNESLNSESLVISSKSGDVTIIGEINSEDAKISTTHGDIAVGRIQKANISSTSGDISIGTIYELELNTKSGDVYINTLSSKATIKTTKGDVKLSALDGGEVGDADITTTSGDVSIYNPIGKTYNVSTKSGDVNFFGNNEINPEVSIIASKTSDVYMTDVTGKTTVTTNGKVNIGISQMTAPIVITAKNKDVNITVLEDEEVYYNLSSNKKDILIEGIEVNAKSFSNTSDNYANLTITATTGWGQIIIVKSK